MSTYDVPGANPANGDELAMGCWAEHEDGSLIFVESTEADRVVYSIFDVSKLPIVEYRDAMPEEAFKRRFSWDPTKTGQTVLRWTWHDKTPFPWERVIKEGAQDGLRHASAAETMSAAARVGESLALRARELDAADVAHRAQSARSRVLGIVDQLRDALGKLPW